jgi:hypothetical protein
MNDASNNGLLAHQMDANVRSVAAAAAANNYYSSQHSQLENSSGMGSNTNSNTGTSSNTGSNSNDGDISTTFSPHNRSDTTATASDGASSVPFQALGQILQPAPVPNINGGLPNNNGGILDPQTRLLLETILRLDDQMIGVVTNSSSINNDTSTTSSGPEQQPQQKQQQQQLVQAETPTECTSSSEGKGGDSPTIPAPANMFREWSSSSSSSGSVENIQVPCRARGQPPEHNYLVRDSFRSFLLLMLVSCSSATHPFSFFFGIPIDGLFYHQEE